MALISDLLEALGDKIRRAKLDSIAFLKAEWHDKHVMEALAHIAKLTGESEATIKTRVEDKVKEFLEIAKYSKILYEQIAANVIEAELFQELQKASEKHTPEDLTRLNKAHGRKGAKFDVFDPVLFRKLCTQIQVENDRFFPLRNFSDDLPLRSLRWILVPSDHPENKKYNSVTTAAATPTGEFIFNTRFMQSLIDYAEIKDLKPKGKKYTNNGGKFPTGYAYIEFLIMHELMHYSQSDFHYGQIFKEVDHTILNWVGDFRSNYDLVKHDFEQLPIGLFSQHVNYDRQNTYEEMIKVVQDELAKLPESLEDKIKKLMKKIMDEHDPGEEDGEGEGSKPGEGEQEGGSPGNPPPKGGKPGKPGEGKGKPGEGKDGKPGEGKDGKPGEGKDGKPGEGKDGKSGSGEGEDGKPGKPGKDGEGKGGGKPGDGKIKGKSLNKTAAEIEKMKGEVDKRSKEITDSLGERKEADGTAQAKDGNKATSSANGQPGKGNVTKADGKFNPANIKPDFTWHQMLSRAVKSAEETEETYAKPSRKGITGTAHAHIHGVAAVKPGEKIIETNVKLLIVVDSSGSMSEVLPKVYANLGMLLVTHGVDPSFLFMRFSDVHDLWVCNVKQNEAISHDKKKTKVTELFSTTYGGGTQLTTGLFNDVKEYHANGYNVVLCSDSDVLHSQNFSILKDMVKAFNPFILFDSKATWQMAVSQFQSGFSNMSHLET